MALRLTLQQFQVMTILMASTKQTIYAWDLARRIGSTRYPDGVLKSLETAGWLASIKEAENPNGQPARRFYSATREGIEGARAAMQSLGLILPQPQQQQPRL